MKNHKNSMPYHEWEIRTLQRDKALTIEVLKIALESLSNPEERGGALLSFRAVAEAYGGLGAVAASAGISRESLYRALSPKGNPTLKTLLAVVNAVGLRLSITEAPQAKSKRKKPAERSKAA